MTINKDELMELDMSGYQYKMKLTEMRRLSQQSVARVNNWAMTTSGVVLINKKDIDEAFKNKTVVNFKQTVTELIKLNLTHKEALRFFKKKLIKADGCTSFVVQLLDSRKGLRKRFVDVNLTTDTNPDEFTGSQDDYYDVYPIIVTYSFDLS
jgi:hypothetical protein